METTRLEKLPLNPKVYSIEDIPVGSTIVDIFHVKHKVKEVGYIPYPVALIDCIPVPAVVTKGMLFGRPHEGYFNLALSGIYTLEDYELLLAAQSMLR